MISKPVEILRSPRFWAAFLVLVFVLLGTYVPGVAAKLDQTAIASAVVALVAFIAAASVGGQPSYIDIFGSLKFWSLVLSLAFIFIKAFWPSFPIGEATLQELIAALGVASIGVSYRPVGETK
jgi:hypothetical protein